MKKSNNPIPSRLSFTGTGYPYFINAAFQISVGLTGLKITTSAVPGLFMGLAFQYNYFNLTDKNYNNPMKMGCIITAGYAF